MRARNYVRTLLTNIPVASKYYIDYKIEKAFEKVLY